MKDLTDRQATVWLRVANSALARCLKADGSQQECEGSAIRQANAVSQQIGESDLPNVATLTTVLQASGIPEDALALVVEATQAALVDLDAEALNEAATTRTSVQGHLKAAADALRKHDHPLAQRMATHLDHLRAGLYLGYNGLSPVLDPDADKDDDTTAAGDTDHDVFPPLAAADRTALAGLLLTEAASILRQDDGYDARRAAVQQALCADPKTAVNDDDADDTDAMMQPYPCIVDLFDDVVVYQYGDDLYRRAYTIGADEDADGITFGDPEPCERAYVPVGEAALAERNMDRNVGGGTDRDKIPAADFAGANRSFPIVTPQDVADAARSIGRAGADNYSTDTLKANIIRIARRKGPAFVAKLPDAWKGDQHESSAPSSAAAGAAAATVALVEAGALVELAPVTESGALVGVA